MEYAVAKSLAEEVIQRLKPFCSRIEIAGSIRREKPLCRDIDIVLIPANQGQLAVALMELGQKIKSGPAIHSRIFRGQQVDVYIANEKTWPTILLIRTGSKEHNIKLCSRAKVLALKLHADGSGITLDNGEPWGEIRTESDVFAALQLPYVEPQKRG
jgi:DNA polymerase/3'-5' exonuclease PolX